MKNLACLVMASLASLAVACGDSSGTTDAATTDGPAQGEGGSETSSEGGTGGDAATEAGAAGCEWIEVTLCGGTTKIADFCPSGKKVKTLERCSDASTFTPDTAYQMYLIMKCADSSCATMMTHTQWRKVECCP